MPGGRPTKYNADILAQAREYLERDRPTMAAESGEFREVIPSACGLAMELGIGEATIYRWRDDQDKPEFRGILDAIQEKQRLLLLNCGLTGAFNPAITKLVLGKHGYSDKSETDNKHTFDLSGLSEEELEAIATGQPIRKA